MPNTNILTFNIADMTCGHCVKTITAAITNAFPSSTVKADLSNHTVSITGVEDSAKIAHIITEEGYSPIVVQ